MVANRLHDASPDTPTVIALIALCEAARPLIELAVALKLVSFGLRELPGAIRQGNVGARIQRSLAHPRWYAAAQAALEDPRLHQFADWFMRACRVRVPFDEDDPLGDEGWLLTVRWQYGESAVLRALAHAVLDAVTVPEQDEAPAASQPIA